MWFVDKTPVAVAGVLNLMFSTELGAHLLPDLAGDRDVFDFIRSGGQPVPPEFRVARLDDLLAIRRDSEALAVVRQIVQDASFVQEERALESLSHRLDEAAARIREDKSIWNVAKGAGSEFSLAILGGGRARWSYSRHAPQDRSTGYCHRWSGRATVQTLFRHS